MSTTAGVGATDYVAINPLAVTAMVLGLLSVVVLLGWPLLIVPIAAIIFAILGLRQIHNSSGTQSGRGLAWGGIVLGLAFAGLVATQQIQARITAAREQEQIAKVAAELGERMRQQDWRGAYELFAPQFQQIWPPTQFIDRMEQVLVNERLGELRQVTAGSRVYIEDYAAGRRGFSNLYFTFEKLDQPAPIGAQYVKIGDQWRIEDIPQFFQQANGAQ